MAEGHLRARFLYLGDGRWLAPGEVRWDARGRIVALRRLRPRDAVRPLALFPGLVDAHVHLQLPAISAAPRAFLPWVRAVRAAAIGLSPADARRHAALALDTLARDGTTAIGEIDATGAGLAAAAEAGFAGRGYQELIGFHLDAEASRSLVRARWRPRRGDVAPGLSPHAPHTASPALFAAAAARTRHLAVHCAETWEEQQFLRTGRGPFADLLAELGRLPAGFRPPRRGAVAWLEHLGVLRSGTQLVHCQHLERGDLARIRGSGAAIAVCPGTIRWFGRQPPPVPAWLRAGIPVGLGTDSLASNSALSMRAELQAAAAAWPQLPPATLLAMATTMAARSLGRAGPGRLRRGGRADLFAVAAEHGDRDRLLLEVVHGCLPTMRTWVAGRAARPSAR